MGQTASQIENHIENKREDLGSNLRELENKVKSVTDWHHQFESHPLVFLGVAFGGGAVVASMFGGRPAERRRYSSLGTETRSYGTDSAPRPQRPA
ncbi:MAG: hypothetical protein V4587_19855, partial [Acidobacteriota bacterium]